MKFDNIGSIGLINDISPQDLPDGALSGGQNVRFKDGYLEKIEGYSNVMGTPTVAPYWMLPIVSGSTLYWVYCGLTAVYVTDGTTHTDITRAAGAYSATALINWNGGFLSGIGVFNNGVDDPQVWTPATPSTLLTSMKWDSGNTWAAKSHTAKVIRTFGNFLIALNVTKSGTNYPYLVKWSHPAEAGTQPVTWDETDTTKDAGETDLGGTGGVLIDGLELRDSFFIYKEDSVHVMRKIGGRFIFSLKENFKFGLLSRRCVKEFEGRHVVFSYGDVFVHDGQTANSIINKRMKKWLFDNIDPDNYETSFVTQNHQKNEFMFCFPQVGSTLPDKALIWNYRDDTFGTRDLPDTPHIAYGIVNDGASTTIDSDSRIVDDVSDIINKRNFNPTVLKNLMASGTNLYLLDNTNAADGVAFTSYAERLSSDFGNDDIKFIKKIWPRVISTGEVIIKLGSQMNINDPITWVAYSFNPNTEEYVDTLVKGRFISYYIGSTTDISWKTSEADFEAQLSGRY